MAAAPSSVLSEHLQLRMAGRRLLDAVFLTFRFEPGFFEQEVLPILFDVPLSHVRKIRLAQLEDALRALPGEVAVYYDANGLVTGDAESAQLDVRRIPIRHRTGIFHPKNLLLLVEDAGEAASGTRPQTLIVATMSANLTRAGWWENVEVCHVEEIAEGAETSMKDDLTQLLRMVKERGRTTSSHAAADSVVRFLKKSRQRSRRSTYGRLFPQFYSGDSSVVEFIDRVAGSTIRRECRHLEVISPYFDESPGCLPLQELIDWFHPTEVRVYLPRSATGQAECPPALYDSVREAGCYWARLPRDITRLGGSLDAGDRRVHAKVYRFFSTKSRREICFVGSPNLTRSAHQHGGNFETGILVDVPVSRRPEFWLQLEETVPTEFAQSVKGESGVCSAGSKLSITFHWDRNQADAFWVGTQDSPSLSVWGRGVMLGVVAPLVARTTTQLTSDFVAEIRSIIGETSILEVRGEAEQPTTLLIQEEGMSHKPSVLQSLTTAEILQYWSLLSPAQRATFTELRSIAGLDFDGDAGKQRLPQTCAQDTIFDRFAGYFHAFGSLERSVREALNDKRTKQARYQLFGRKFDSLGSLLERVQTNEESADDVDRYVLFMSARQMIQEIQRDYPDLFDENREDVKELNRQLVDAGEVRQRLVETNPQEMTDFLNWFDDWFLKREKPMEVEP